MKSAIMVLLGIVAALSVGIQAHAGPKIEGKPVEYAAGGATLKGYLAWDENIKGTRPGVIVVHE